MTTIFDGSSRAGELPTQPRPEPVPELDSLQLLRQAVAEQVEFEPAVVHCPHRIGVRLICGTDISNKDMSRWQKAALPPHLRKAGKFSPFEMNQFVWATSVLTNSLDRIEVLAPGTTDEWITVEDSRDGRPLRLDDDAVLGLFGVMDTASLLLRLFGREVDVIKAGQHVSERAGYGDDEGGVDPT